MILVALKYRWKPAVVVVDYEKALLNSVAYQFPGSKTVGCYFHYRQALQRKLAKFGVAGRMAEEIMARLEALTAVEDREFLNELECLERDPEFASAASSRFFLYFRRTWIVRFPPSLWRNVASDPEDNGARTNNCLERYNRRLGEVFLNAHPSLSAFVAAIQGEEEFYSDLVRLIRSGSIEYVVGFEL